MKKGQRSSGRVLAPNLGNKANREKHKIFYSRASVTLKAVSLQLNGMLMMCKIQQAMKDDAIRTTRIHPVVHPDNRDEVFIWRHFQPAYRDLGWIVRCITIFHTYPLFWHFCWTLIRIINSTAGAPSMHHCWYLSQNIFYSVERSDRE